jgi:hypothetical protein
MIQSSAIYGIIFSIKHGDSGSRHHYGFVLNNLSDIRVCMYAFGMPLC